MHGTVPGGDSDGDQYIVDGPESTWSDCMGKYDDDGNGTGIIRTSAGGLCWVRDITDDER